MRFSVNYPMLMCYALTMDDRAPRVHGRGVGIRSSSGTSPATPYPAPPSGSACPSRRPRWLVLKGQLGDAKAVHGKTSDTDQEEGRVCKELILSPAPRPPRAPLRARHPSTCSSRRRASTLGGALYSPRVFQCDKIEQAARHDMSRRGDQHRLHPAGTVAAALLTSTGLIVIGQYIQGLVVWCFTESSKSYSEF
jgi:hypothetical protein